VLFADSLNSSTASIPRHFRPRSGWNQVNKEVDAVEALGKTYGTMFGGQAGGVRLQDDPAHPAVLSSRLTVRLFVIAAFLLGAAGLLILDAGPDGDVRPTAGERGHETGGGHQLVHPGAVHARRSRAGAHRGIPRHRCARRVQTLLPEVAPELQGRSAGRRFPGEPVVARCSSSSGTLGVVGILIGAIGAGIAVSRFLDV